MIDKNKLNLVADFLKRSKGSSVVYPTDEEVIAAVEVFNALTDVGNILGLEMLVAWAVSMYSYYNGIAFARNIRYKVVLNEPPSNAGFIEKP